jgi:hypothetical protein
MEHDAGVNRAAPKNREPTIVRLLNRAMKKPPHRAPKYVLDAPLKREYTPDSAFPYALPSLLSALCALCGGGFFAGGTTNIFNAEGTENTENAALNAAMICRDWPTAVLPQPRVEIDARIFEA